MVHEICAPRRYRSRRYGSLNHQFRRHALSAICVLANRTDQIAVALRAFAPFGGQTRVVVEANLRYERAGRRTGGIDVDMDVRGQVGLGVPGWADGVDFV